MFRLLKTEHWLFSICCSYTYYYNSGADACSPYFFTYPQIFGKLHKYHIIPRFLNNILQNVQKMQEKTIFLCRKSWIFHLLILSLRIAFEKLSSFHNIIILLG